MSMDNDKTLASIFGAFKNQQNEILPHWRVTIFNAMGDIMQQEINFFKNKYKEYSELYNDLKDKKGENDETVKKLDGRLYSFYNLIKSIISTKYKYSEFDQISDDFDELLWIAEKIEKHQINSPKYDVYGVIASNLFANEKIQQKKKIVENNIEDDEFEFDEESLYEKIVLRGEQIEAHDKGLEILNKSYFLLNISIMGAGKTIMTGKLIQDFSKYGDPIKHLFVVGQNDMGARTWDNLFSKYYIQHSKLGLKGEIDGYITFSSLVGGKRKIGEIYDKKGREILSNGLLLKETKDGIVRFIPTEKLRKMVAENCIVIFDEFSNTKNKKTLAYKSVGTIIHFIRDYVNENPDCKSRVIMLSGTPSISLNENVDWFHLVGINSQSDINSEDDNTDDENDDEEGENFDDENGDVSGFEEIRSFCYNIDRKETMKVLKEYPKSDRPKITVRQLYVSIILKHFAISASPNILFQFDARNYYMPLSKQREKKAKFLLSQMREKDRFDKMTKNIILFENQMLEPMPQEIFEQLEADPKCKIVIMMNNPNNLKILQDLVTELNPNLESELIVGKTTKTQRRKIIDKFQEPNTKLRLLFCNLQICSLSIDLHDTNGNFKRYAYIFLNFNTIQTHQAMFRFYRENVKSNPVMRLVFPSFFLEFESDDIFTRAYIKKAEHLQLILPNQQKLNIQFPGVYKKEIKTLDRVKYIDYIEPITSGDAIDYDEEISPPKPKTTKKKSTKKTTKKSNLKVDSDFDEDDDEEISSSKKNNLSDDEEEVSTSNTTKSSKSTKSSNKNNCDMTLFDIWNSKYTMIKNLLRGNYSSKVEILDDEVLDRYNLSKLMYNDQTLDPNDDKILENKKYKEIKEFEKYKDALRFFNKNFN